MKAIATTLIIVYLFFSVTYFFNGILIADSINCANTNRLRIVFPAFKLGCYMGEYIEVDKSLTP